MSDAFSRLAQAAESLWQTPDRVPGRHLDLPAGPIWLRDAGGPGRPLLLLHANTGTSESWQHVFAPLQAAGLRPIAFDRPGKGASAPRPDGASVAEVALELAGHLGLARFALAGVAGGAFIALDCAAMAPQRISHLALMATTGQFDEPDLKAAVARIEIPGIRSQPAAYRELGPSYRAADPEGVALWSAIHDHAGAQGGAASPDLSTANRYEKLARLPKILGVLAGGADLIAPPALMRIWMQRLPGQVLELPLQILPEAGHAPQWENPEEVARFLIRLIAEAAPQ